MTYIQSMFRLEESWEDLSTEERLHQRQKQLKPLMEEFFNWCRSQAVLPGSKLGKALDYALKYEATFKTVLEDGRLVLSNNIAERAVKTLVMGRSEIVWETISA